MARYKYTQESGITFKVNTSDKCDAYEDINEIRQILDDLGELLAHTKFDDSYPEDATAGGTLAIPYTAIAAMTSAQLAGIISNETGSGLLVFGTAPSITTINLTGGQITFPASQNASTGVNTLDDYEEGSWTPALKFGGNSVGMTYTTQAGLYTKIGRQVTITGYIILTAKGTSVGGATITGLPFVSKLTLGAYSSVSLNLFDVTFANAFQGFVAQNQAVITLYETTEAGTATTLNNTNLANTSQMVFSATYFTD